MAVYKKGDTYFTSFRYPGSRRQHSKKLNSRNWTDARKEDRAMAAERDRLHAEGRLFEPKDMPLKELIDKYMGISEGNGNCAVTLQRQRHHFRRIEELLGVEMVSEVTVQSLEDLKLKGLRSGAAPSVVNKHLIYAKALLRQARRLKLKTLSSDEVYEVGQVKASAPTPAFFLAEEQAKILAVASPFWRVATLLAGLGGLRRGEAMSLLWTEVRFGRREMAIMDRADHRTKTRISKTVPLHDELFDALVEWRKANPEETHVLPWRKYEDPQKNANEFSHAFHRLCKKAGVKGSYKSLRHGFATGLMQQDVSTLKIQAAMGHKSVKTTEKYGHVRAPDLPDAINKLPSPVSLAGKFSNHFSNQKRDFKQREASPTNISLDGGTV